MKRVMLRVMSRLVVLALFVVNSKSTIFGKSSQSQTRFEGHFVRLNGVIFLEQQISNSLTFEY